MKKQSEKITALYCRLSCEDEKEGLSGSIQNQWDLEKLSPREYYRYCQMGVYPLKSGILSVQGGY